MLKGVPSILNPDLLKIMAEMGHGDTIVIGDRNFPITSLCERRIHLEGTNTIELLDAMLRFFPLDCCLKDRKDREISPFCYMKSNDRENSVPEIVESYKCILERFEPSVQMGSYCRSDFYPEAQKAYAGIQTSDDHPYACVILRKGIV